MKLNLGCGSNKIEGWVNVDLVEEFKPDLLHDISLPFPYKDNSVDEILAKDILEHFDKYLRYVVFYEWARILKIGGIITIVVPNFPKVIRRYFKYSFNTFLDRIFGETMRDSERYIGHFGIHKYGYSEDTLKKFVQEFGLKPIKIEKYHANFTLVASKLEHIKKESVDNMKIYLSDNDNGLDGRSISVKQVRQRVDDFLVKNRDISRF